MRYKFMAFLPTEFNDLISVVLQKASGKGDVLGIDVEGESRYCDINDECGAIVSGGKTEKVDDTAGFDVTTACCKDEDGCNAASAVMPTLFSLLLAVFLALNN